MLRHMMPRRTFHLDPHTHTSYTNMISIRSHIHPCVVCRREINDPIPTVNCPHLVGLQGSFILGSRGLEVPPGLLKGLSLSVGGLTGRTGWGNHQRDDSLPFQRVDADTQR